MTVPRIQWTAANVTYTPDRPCRFDDRCTPAAFTAWQLLSSQWLAAAAEAGNAAVVQGELAERERDFQVGRLSTYWRQLSADGAECDVLSCKAYVDGFVSVAKQSRELVIRWGGEAPDQPGSLDPNWKWPWEDGDGWELPDLGGGMGGAALAIAALVVLIALARR